MITSSENAATTAGELQRTAKQAILIDPLVDPLWDRLATSHHAGTIFHHSAWARVLHRTYGHRPCYLALSKGHDTNALLPFMEVHSLLTGRRGVCVPFADVCDPLFFRGADVAKSLGTVRSMGAERGWRYFELRGEIPTASASPSVSYFTHALDLRCGLDATLASFESPVRRAIRKAERSGLCVEIRTDGDAMRQFFHLHARTRRKHGLPPQPLAFFRHVHEEIIRVGLGVVVLVSQGERPVAAAIFFHTGSQAIYKFGASDERVQESRANNLAMWAGIQHLAGLGCETLHLGRTSRGQEGLRRYKLGWGAAESTFNYFKYDLRRGAWVTDCDRASGFHNTVFSRLPLSLNRLLGRFIYPHLA